MSEMITLVVLFHRFGYRYFKHFYQCYVANHLQAVFPTLISYSRFIRFTQLMPSILFSLCAYLQSLYGKPTDISYIDSAKLAVCHNLCIPRHHVFQRGKTSCGWFYGFKLYVVTNQLDHLLAVKPTPSNIDDRERVTKIVMGLFGKLFGEKGYLSQTLAAQLQAQKI